MDGKYEVCAFGIDVFFAFGSQSSLPTAFWSCSRRSVTLCADPCNELIAWSCWPALGERPGVGRACVTGVACTACALSYSYIAELHGLRVVRNHTMCPSSAAIKSTHDIMTGMIPFCLCFKPIFWFCIFSALTITFGSVLQYPAYQVMSDDYLAHGNDTRPCGAYTTARCIQ